ncbi:MAG TPA: hypothetical protein VI894_01820 [Candidatus Nanoarchaeia archaeon]|nr:hypothetical protein [Candidatus Nanoarchaeia archaeon]
MRLGINAFILSLIMILSINVVFATGGLDIIQNYVSLSGTGTPTGSFNVSNTNSSVLFVSFSNYTLIHVPNCTLNISPITSVYVLNGTTMTISFQVNVPSAQPPGNYTGTLVASSGNLTDSVQVSVDVPQNPNVSLSNPSVTVVQGNSVTASAAITNTGNLDLTAQLSVSNLVSGNNSIPSSNILIVPSTVTISVSQNTTINITAVVPSNQPAGAYAGTINASYNGKITSSTLTVTVNAINKDFTLSAPASATWTKGISTSASTTVVVNNTGNINLQNVALALNNLVSGTYNVSSSYASISQNNFALNAGQTQTVTITFSGIPSSQFSTTYLGTLTASSDNLSRTSSVSLVVKDPAYSLSNPSELTHNVERNRTYSNVFTISNNGDYAITNLNISSTAQSKYNVAFNPSIVSLAQGESKSITATYFVPVDQASGKQSIGSIVLSNSQITKSFPLYFQTQSMLEIYDIDVAVDNKYDDIGLGEDISEKARPGSKITLEVEVRNKWTSTEKIDIEDIKITGTLRDIDDGDDLEEETDSFDLRYNSKVRKTLAFTVPLDADEDFYDFKIIAEGDEKNGAKDVAETTIRLEVDRKSHDLVVYSAELGSPSVSCNRQTILYVKVANLGSTYEDRGLLTVSNSDLGLDYARKFELGKDARDDKNILEEQIPIDAENLSAGTYKILLKTYYDGTILYDQQSIDLAVKDCVQSATSVATTVQEETQPQQETVVYQLPSSGAPAVSKPVQKSFTDSTAYLVILIALIVLLFLILLVLLIKMIAR